MDSKHKTLGDLARTGDTYWKFSQSEPGRSIEPHFIHYEKGKIVEAHSLKHKLAFTSNNHIGKCFPYGDQLSKFCFDTKVPLFQEIENTPISSGVVGLGEIKSMKLLVEENYSLAEKNTIRILVSLLPDNRDITYWSWHFPFGKNKNFAHMLYGFDFVDSAIMVQQIIQISLKAHLTKKEVLDIIDNYKDF